MVVLQTNAVSSMPAADREVTSLGQQVFQEQKEVYSSGQSNEETRQGSR